MIIFGFGIVLSKPTIPIKAVKHLILFDKNIADITKEMFAEDKSAKNDQLTKCMNTD
jgi:hypothetical protein